jgi:hypothetical protein
VTVCSAGNRPRGLGGAVYLLIAYYLFIFTYLLI